MTAFLRRWNGKKPCSIPTPRCRRRWDGWRWWPMPPMPLAQFATKRYAGEIAGFTTFSFHAVKNLTTGEGGAVTWRPIPGISDDELYQQYMLLSLHGQSKDALAKTQLGAWEYDIVAPYYKCNMTDIMASLGLAQLKRYPGMLRRRRELIECYDEALADKPVTVRSHYGPDFSSSGHLYLMNLNGKGRKERDDFIIQPGGEGNRPPTFITKPLPAPIQGTGSWAFGPEELSPCCGIV